jgi:hypothetical protein
VFCAKLQAQLNGTGVSKSAVAAGLIGGRVGNKGGVGVSLNISGTTFLFINAHLAGQFSLFQSPRCHPLTSSFVSTAHGGKQHHRLANLAKIKVSFQRNSLSSIINIPR